MIGRERGGLHSTLHLLVLGFHGDENTINSPAVDGVILECVICADKKQPYFHVTLSITWISITHSPPTLSEHAEDNYNTCANSRYQALFLSAYQEPGYEASRWPSIDSVLY